MHNIRLANDNDFEDIFSIWIDGISSSFDMTTTDMSKIKEKFQSNFDSRHGIFNFWVATDDQKKIIGWQSLIKNSNNPFRHNISAESSTYVAKSYRKSGIGKDLLDYVIDEAIKSDLEYITAFISLTNEGIRKIANEQGWKEIGEMPPSLKSDSKIKKLFIVKPV